MTADSAYKDMDVLLLHTHTHGTRPASQHHLDKLDCWKLSAKQHQKMLCAQDRHCMLSVADAAGTLQ
jgi:hypothetical protein